MPLILKGDKMSDTLSQFAPIWAVDTHFKCPVIGAVLTVEKHKQILKKCGYNIKKMQPYEYHQRLMTKLSDKNNVSIKVNNYLKSRARKYMVAIEGKSEKDIRKLWIEQSLKGNVGPLLFAIVSYQQSSVELLHDVYGEVHMQAHANMTEVYDIRQKLALAEKTIANEKNKNQQKKEDIKQWVNTHKANLLKIEKLEKENLKHQRKIQTLEERQVSDQNTPTIIEDLQLRIQDLESQLVEKAETIRIKEREKRSLEIDLFSTRKDKRMFETQIQTLIDGIDALRPPSFPEQDQIDPSGCSAENCSQETCSQYQLCSKRVFMIGGITKMKQYYKTIVEKAGGQFDYHDGYLKSASCNLEARVKRSDIVICPVNCNSHNACLKVKKLCNQYKKELKLLSCSSLSAITRALLSDDNRQVVN